MAGDISPVPNHPASSLTSSTHKNHSPREQTPEASTRPSSFPRTSSWPNRVQALPLASQLHTGIGYKTYLQSTWEKQNLSQPKEWREHHHFSCFQRDQCSAESPYSSYQFLCSQWYLRCRWKSSFQQLLHQQNQNQNLFTYTWNTNIKSLFIRNKRYVSYSHYNTLFTSINFQSFIFFFYSF